MITEDYVSFETAKLLKEKGFDNNTNCYYIEDFNDLYYSPIRENHNASIENNEFDVHINISSGKMSAPTLQMAMKWLRKIHNIIIVPTQYHKYMKKKVCDEFHYGCLIFKLNTDCPLSDDNFLNKKYEKSCDSAIKYCLENLI